MLYKRLHRKRPWKPQKAVIRILVYNSVIPFWLKFQFLLRKTPWWVNYWTYFNLCCSVILLLPRMLNSEFWFLGCLFMNFISKNAGRLNITGFLHRAQSYWNSSLRIFILVIPCQNSGRTKVVEQRPIYFRYSSSYWRGTFKRFDLLLQPAQWEIKARDLKPSFCHGFPYRFRFFEKDVCVECWHILICTDYLAKYLNDRKLLGMVSNSLLQFTCFYPVILPFQKSQLHSHTLWKSLTISPPETIFPGWQYAKENSSSRH